MEKTPSSVLVDTPIWSLALRRDSAKLSVEQTRLRRSLAALIEEDRAAILGSIRQEILSGIRDAAVFARLQQHLRSFRDEDLSEEDYEEASRIFNSCAAAGIAGSSVDFLICAVAVRRNWEIFTTDQDFERYARHVPLALHQPPRPPGLRSTD